MDGESLMKTFKIQQMHTKSNLTKPLFARTWSCWVIYGRTEWAVAQLRLIERPRWTLPLQLVLHVWERIYFVNVSSVCWYRFTTNHKNLKLAFLPLSFLSKMAQSFSALFSGVLSSLGRFACFSFGMRLKIAWWEMRENRIKWQSFWFEWTHQILQSEYEINIWITVGLVAIYIWITVTKKNKILNLYISHLCLCQWVKQCILP